MSEPEDVEPTTERLDPDACSGSATSYLNYLFHLASYDFAARMLEPGARVLDFGCGTGYGTHHLASGRSGVVAGAGLDGLRRVSGGVGSLRRRRAAAVPGTPASYSFGLGDIRIEAGARASSNIVLTATRI